MGVTILVHTDEETGESLEALSQALEAGNHDRGVTVSCSLDGVEHLGHDGSAAGFNSDGDEIEP